MDDGRADAVHGTEGPRGHEASVPVDDRIVPSRVFVSVAAIVGLMGAIYWATAYEEGGTVLIMLTAGLALWVAAYLWLRSRAAAGAARASAEAGTDAAYLPHASVWPFAIGLGAATVVNGLVLGLWVIVPGVVLLALGLAGFVRQTRRRD